MAAGHLATPSSIDKLVALEASISAVIRGKSEQVRLAIACLLAKGHLRIEDVRGVGKTTLARALAGSVNCQFQRIQFTSDMLPSEVFLSNFLL